MIIKDEPTLSINNDLRELIACTVAQVALFEKQMIHIVTSYRERRIIGIALDSISIFLHLIWISREYLILNEVIF